MHNFKCALIRLFSSNAGRRKARKILSRKWQSQTLSGMERLENRSMLTGTPLDRGVSFVTNPIAAEITHQKGTPEVIARQYLTRNYQQLGLTLTDVVDPIVTSQYTDQASGASHIYFRQQVGGIEVATADMSVTVLQSGQVFAIGNRFLSGLDSLVDSTPAQLSGAAAVLSAAQQLHVPPVLHLVELETGSGFDRSQSFAGGVISRQPTIPVKLVYQPGNDGLVHLAWNMNFDLYGETDNWVDLNVDATTGRILAQASWTAHLDSYNVYDHPTDAPHDGSRSIISDPADPTFSPFGWHDTNGVAGPESTLTMGNNVVAQEDTDANNSGGFRPDGGGSLNFDFPLDLGQAPSTYQSAAITQLFYTINTIHDTLAHHGFTEAAGNFQVTNYSGLGVGGDPVQADAQDGEGTNNANFSTPPDGTPGRMQQFIWTQTSPNRDSDLDLGVIAHEFGHGVSNRLTGGPANSSALNAWQSAGMGEGWSDFWTVMFAQRAGDVATDGVGVGTYLLGQAPDGAGIRQYPYTTDMSVNPFTMGDFNSGINSVHRTGTIWNTVLWDLNWKMIEKYGFDPNLRTGTGGNNLTMKMVIEGMKIQPALPTFLDARDAIIAANEIHNGGADVDDIWEVFARRGFGFSAIASDPDSSVVEAFDLPYVSPPLFSADFSDASGNPSNDGFTIGGGLWHLTQHRGNDFGHSADDSMWYGDEGLGTYDVGDSSGYITSPTIEILGANPRLSFNYFLAVEEDTNQDIPSVLISTDLGANFSPLNVMINRNGGAFDEASADLSAYSGQFVQIRFSFDTVDAADNAHEGWIVDDVVVQSTYTPVTIFDADFSNSGGGADLDGFTIDSGLWHLTQHRGLDAGHSADDSMWYANEATGNYDTGAANAGSITSPPINLIGVNPFLSFNYFLEAESNPAYDVPTVLVSSDDGTTFNPLSVALDKDSGGFARATADLSGYVGATILVRFNFDTGDDFDNAYEGWIVDDVKVSALMAQVADHNIDFSAPNGDADLEGFTINSGLWHLTQHRGTDPGHSPDDSMWYANEATGTYNTGSTNSGFITSPTFNVSGPGAALTFNYLLETEQFSGFDVPTVLIASNGGGYSAVPVSLVDGDGVFHQATVDLSPYIGTTVQVRFDFNTVDGQYNDFEGWMIDDVMIVHLVQPNSNPVVAVNDTMVVLEGDSGPFTDLLEVTDPQQSASEIVYTLITPPLHGYVGDSSQNPLTTFTQQEINNFIVSYWHDGSDTTSDSFVVWASDGHGGFTDPITFNISITAVNDGPVIADFANTVNYVENGGPLAILAATTTVTDSDSADFNTGTLDVFVVDGSAAQDVLSIISQGLISTSGNTVTYNGFQIGTFTGGTNGNHLVVTFDSGDATPQAVTELIKAIGYSNNSDSPFTSPRTIQFTLTDGDGGTSNLAAADVTITPVNDAPILANGSPTLFTINEDVTNPSGTAVSNFANSLITDADVGASKGIAVIGLTGTSDGVWQFSTNNGSTWTALGNPSDSAARLLFQANKVRFIPNTNFAGAPTLTFRAWDRSNGLAAGSVLSITTIGTGGSTPFSTNSVTATQPITPKNDAPVLSGSSPSLTTINEDATSPGGTLVSSFANSLITDPDIGASKGIAVTGLTQKSNGTWQYSLNNGATWTAIGNPSSTAALVLVPVNKVRFVPNPNWNGTATLTFRAWDRTDGAAAGAVVNTDGKRGGTGAYSTGTIAANLVVTAINDAPVLNPGSPVLFAIPEDATSPSGTPVSYFASPLITEADTGFLKGIAVTGLTQKVNGAWQFSIDNGVTWAALGDPTDTAARVLAPADKVRFVPNANYNGSPTLKFRAWDQTDGAVRGTVVNTDGKRGGTGAYSTGTNTASLNVTPINDAPKLNNSLSPTMDAVAKNDSNSAGTVISQLLVGMTDVDAGALQGIAITNLPQIAGTWEYSLNNGTTWLSAGAPTVSAALLLRSTDKIRLKPGLNFTGTVNLWFRAWDQTDGKAPGTTANTSTYGGSTAFSTNLESASVTVS